MASYKINDRGKMKRDAVNNFGRTEVTRILFPKFDERLVDVQVDEVMSWTVVIDVLAVTPSTRVWARIEYGAGSTNSVDIVDVADHVDYPVVGDSVRVAFGVESTIIPGEGSATPSANPPAAKVSCSCSAEFPGYTFPATYFPPFLAPAQQGVIGPVSGLTTPPFTPQAVPARLAAYQAVAINAGAGALFFQLFDQNTVPVAGDLPVWSAPFIGGQAQLQFLNPKPFDNSVQWAISTIPNVLALPGPAVSAAVFGELSRRPLGQIVAAIQEISGGLF